MSAHSIDANEKTPYAHGPFTWMLTEEDPVTFLVTQVQREAIKNGEPLSWPVLSSFLGGALPHFWDECLELADHLHRGEKMPRLDIPLFADGPAEELRLGMALIGYRRAVAEHVHCRLAMPHPMAIVALSPQDRLSETPCATYLSANIRENRPAGFAVIQEMAAALSTNPTFIARDVPENDLEQSSVSTDLQIICGTDPYRVAFENMFGMCMAMQRRRIAMKRRDIESREFDRFCSVDELIATWPNPRLAS